MRPASTDAEATKAAESQRTRPADDNTSTAVTQPNTPARVPRPPVRPRGALPPPTLPPRTSPPQVTVSAFGAHTFARLPEDLRATLVASGQLVVLADRARLPDATAYHVLAGGIRASTMQFAGVTLGKGAALLGHGSVAAPQPKLHAEGEKTTLVCWHGRTFADAVSRYPWVEVELRQVTDRVVALCGAAVGPLADRVDAFLQTMQHFELLVLAPRELLVGAGAALPGLCVLGAGSLEIEGAPTAAAGHVLFPMAALQGAKAPRACRAGPLGALVLVALAAKARELAVTYRPLREILQAGTNGP